MSDDLKVGDTVRLDDGTLGVISWRDEQPGWPDHISIDEADTDGMRWTGRRITAPRTTITLIAEGPRDRRNRSRA